MKQIEYNLLEERWVRVRGQDYTVQEVSLPDALLHAQALAGLARDELASTGDLECGFLYLLCDLAYACVGHLGKCGTNNARSAYADI